MMNILATMLAGVEAAEGPSIGYILLYVALGLVGLVVLIVFLIFTKFIKLWAQAYFANAGCGWSSCSAWRCGRWTRR